MSTGIILAGGESRRMPGDKAFMELSGRRVIDIQLEVLGGLFEEVLIVGNPGRMESLSVFERNGVRAVVEPVVGMGPLGGIASGLILSRTDENFVVACDMPFIKREAVSHVMSHLPGFQVAVPNTPKGLEPLHAAYRKECIEVIERQLDAKNLKVTGFYERVAVRRIPWEEFLSIDPTGRLLFNINSPEDMREAAGVQTGLHWKECGRSGKRKKEARMPEEIPQEVIEALKRESTEGKIPCERAQKLAGELGVPMLIIGQALDGLGIKIVECQLGCF